MNSLLDLPLKDPSSGRLVEIGNFENMSGIDPVIGPSSHNLVAIHHKFVDRNLGLSVNVTT